MKRQEIESQLKKKFGFEPVKQSKHDAVALFHNGKKVATTRFSRGNKGELGDKLLKLMATQIRVETVSDFKEMIECTISREAYMEMLQAGGYLPSEE